MHFKFRNEQRQVTQKNNRFMLGGGAQRLPAFTPTSCSNLRVVKEGTPAGEGSLNVEPQAKQTTNS